MTVTSAASESAHVSAGHPTAGFIDDDHSAPPEEMQDGSIRPALVISSDRATLNLPSSSPASVELPPAPPSVDVAFARAFVQLDCDFGHLFNSTSPSWLCLHTCTRACHTARSGASQHNVSSAMHPHCDAQCDMHKYLTLRHRAVAPDAESRARWEECKRRALDVYAMKPQQHSEPALVHNCMEMQLLQQQLAIRDIERAVHVGQLQGLAALEMALARQLQSAHIAILAHREQVRELIAVRENRDRAVASLSVAQIESSQRIADLRASHQAAVKEHRAQQFESAMYATDLRKQLRSAEATIRVHRRQERDHAAMREERDRAFAAHAAAQTARAALSQGIADLRSSHQVAIEAHRAQQRDSAARETALGRSCCLHGPHFTRSKSRSNNRNESWPPRVRSATERSPLRLRHHSASPHYRPTCSRRSRRVSACALSSRRHMKSRFR